MLGDNAAPEGTLPKAKKAKTGTPTVATDAVSPKL